jgi:translation initiation factor IF-2
VAEYREKKKRDMAQAARSGKVTLENLFSRVTSGEVKELGVVVKGDVQGSVEAIVDALGKLATDEVKVRVLHSAVGVITESDVMLATASNALIIGFSVRANAQARDLAEREGIELRYYSIIYNLIDDVKAAMAGMLAPTFKENVLGHASIRDVIRVSKVGNIAGCMVIDGLIRRNAKVRLLRDGVVIHEGSLASLKRFKDDAREVANGFECGLSIDRYDDIRVGDVVECYEMEQVQAVLGETQGEKDKKAAAKQPNA